jgi:general secretion pathway protein I
MAELTEKYERTGFSIGGDTADGTFEEEGHPDFAWRSETVEPQGTLDGKALASILLGGGSVADLFAPKADADGRELVNPAAAGMAAVVEQQLNGFAQTIKKGVRELRLTISWKEGARDESFTVVTHLVAASAGGPK